MMIEAGYPEKAQILLNQHSLIITGRLETMTVPQASLNLMSKDEKDKKRSAKLFLRDCVNQGDLDATLILCNYLLPHKP